MMAMTTTETSGSRTVLFVLSRVVGAALLGAMGGIHVYLWAQGYKSIALIGILFLLNGIGGGVLMLGTLATPNRFLALVAALGSLFTLGTLAALLLSLTTGLFGFQESMAAPLVTTTIVVEAAGVLVLAALAAFAFRAFGLLGNVSNGSGVKV